MDQSVSPQFFSFQEEPPKPQAWYRNPQIIKKILLIGGIFIAVLFLGLFLYNVIKNRGGNAQSALDATKQEITARQAECEQGNESCMTQTQADIARVAGQAEACEGLNDAKKENCVTLIAKDKKDSTLCGELSAEAKTRCADAVALRRAADGEGMSVCDDIVDASLKSACTAQVESTARAKGNCAELGVDEGVCDTRAQLEAIYVAGNMAACAELEQSLREECLDYFTSIDADGDGLRADEEAKIGASDRLADTDGDGYDDGTEVRSGYDPLK